MPKMVYIKELFPHSFLHLSPSGEAFKLRDFSEPRQTAGRVVKQQAPPEWTTSRILEFANVVGNVIAEVPERPIADYDYWHDETVKLNQKYIRPEATTDDPPPSAHTIIVKNENGGLRGQLAYVVATVVAAIAAAGILAWLKWK